MVFWCFRLICRSSVIYLCACLSPWLLCRFLEIFHYLSLQCSPPFSVNTRHLIFIGLWASARLCLLSGITCWFLKKLFSKVYIFNFLIASFTFQLLNLTLIFPSTWPLANIQYICGKIYIINSYIVIHSKPALATESWDRSLQHGIDQFRGCGNRQRKK